MIELPSLGLPKWPALLVVGEPVTKEQAQEINIRTSSLPWLSTNNSEFCTQIYEYIYKVKNLKNYWDFDGVDNVKEEYGILDIEYLHNHNICSSWVGGPHGWCNWEGKIFANTFNIGKWPSIEEVYREWCVIAAAFPFLTLKSQLLNIECGEYSEGEKEPRALIQFEIKEGTVDVVIEPDSLIAEPEEYEFRSLFDTKEEIGCSVVEFINAVEYTKSQLIKANKKVTSNETV